MSFAVSPRANRAASIALRIDAEARAIVHPAPKCRWIEGVGMFYKTTGRTLSLKRAKSAISRVIHTPAASTGRERAADLPAPSTRPIMPIDIPKIEQLTRELLRALGEDAEREGLLKTPERVAKAMAFLTSGYRTDVSALINDAIFTQTTNSMVIVKNIEVYSLCEHHMLPFFGRCHIGYIPTGRVFGVSKLARLVDMYARRLQLQERLTEQISQAVLESIDARGVGVMIEARHLCMMMRGVEKQNSEMITSSVLGTFRDSEATRDEFLALIGPRGI
jgi:GTP cyclohydrolase IA